MEKIELTKSEVNGLSVRASLLNDLETRVAIHKREFVATFQELLEKKGLEGEWQWQGDFLVKQQVPEVKKDKVVSIDGNRASNK